MLPKDDKGRVILNEGRIKYWISVGAQPTERVSKFLKHTHIPLSKEKRSRATIKPEDKV